MTESSLLHGNFRVAVRKRRQLVEMVILPPVFVVRKGLLEPRGICQRVVPKLHWNRLPCHDLPEEYVECGRHGNANAVEDDVGLALDGIVHTEVDLNSCCRFHVSHCIKSWADLSIVSIVSCYTINAGADADEVAHGFDEFIAPLNAEKAFNEFFE